LGIYSRWIFPTLIDKSMRNRFVAEFRVPLIARATGRVLEVGIGSGLNLPLFSDAVEHVTGLDPSAELLRLAAVQQASRPFALVQANAEAIPFAASTFDSVVLAWSLCSTRDAASALAEIRRVLRPDGQLLFAEHGLAADPAVGAWQRRLDPLWVRISCHLDLDVKQLLEHGGFDITELETGHLGEGPKIMTFMYRGRAQPLAGFGEPVFGPAQ